MARTRIGEILVQAGLLTPQRLEEALRAQQIYGGRLGTVLVEHGFVHEDNLARALSSQSGMPLVSRDALLHVDPAVIALLSSAQAERFQVVPFQHEAEQNRILLAMTEPSNLHAMDELQFALGRRVGLYLCPEVILARALEKYYGLTRPLRFIRVQVDGSRPAAAAGPAAQPAAARPPDILERIARAETAQDLLDTVLGCLTTFATQAVFFACHGDKLQGWGARGLNAHPDVLTATEIRTSDSPVLHLAFARQQAFATSLEVDEALRVLLTEQLAMDRDEPVVVAPLIVAQRPYGAFVLARPRSGKTVDPALMGELVHRVGLRAQAISLMECVRAPLSGCS